MGLLKRLKELLSWCPQPPDRSPTKLKRYSIPIAVALVASIVLAAVVFRFFLKPYASAPVAACSSGKPPHVDVGGTNHH